MAQPLSRPLLVLAWLAIAAILSGCLQYDGDVSVSESGQLNGEFEWTLPRAVYDASGEDNVDRFTGRLADNPLLPLGVRTETIDGNDRIGQRFTFDKVETVNLGDVDLGFKVLIDEEGRIDFTADVEELNGNVSSRLALDSQPYLDASVQGTMTVEFPYEVVETNGTINGGEVTWVHDPAQGIFMPPQLTAATSTLSPPAKLGEGGLPWTRVLIGFALLGLVIWLFTGNDETEGAVPRKRTKNKKGEKKRSGSIYRASKPKETGQATPPPPTPQSQPTAATPQQVPAQPVVQAQQAPPAAAVAPQPAAAPQPTAPQPAPAQPVAAQPQPVAAAAAHPAPPANQLASAPQPAAHQPAMAGAPVPRPHPMDPAVAPSQPAHQPFDLSRLARPQAQPMPAPPQPAGAVE